MTLRHEQDEVQITSYPELMWGGDLSDVWKDLTAFVESSYSWVWEAREFGPPDFEHLEVEETTWSRADTGFLETRFYESPPKEETEARRKVRAEAARAAEHRPVALRLGESTVEATVVGEAGMWAAGFETSRPGGPVVVLISGGTVPVDSLELGVVDDLLAYLKAGIEGSQ